MRPEHSRSGPRAHEAEAKNVGFKADQSSMTESRRLSCRVVSDHMSSSSSSCLHNTSTSHTTCGVVRDARSQMLARRKVAKMLIAVVVMFGICFLPVHLLNILRSSDDVFYTVFFTSRR